ncbi:ankyrin repeat domain-containing protein [Mycobacterium sp. BMJ-28]
MASTLPNNPSLDRLRADARALQRAEIASGHEHFALHEAQLATARRYGFSGWPALVRYLRVAAGLSLDPGRIETDTLEPADRFCALAALRYDGADAPPRWLGAAELLGDHPDLVGRHIWAAAAAADPDAVRYHLRTARATDKGGPYGWSPLMYLAYSRVPGAAVATARLLLDAAADPNDGYLWCGMSTPFTVLTGVFGEGEQGPRRQPRHAQADELAALLLDRGAHPVDQQTLYNRMFSADDSHLLLLFAHGLADAAPGPWERRLGEAMETRAQMWQRQVDWAAEHGFADRLALLARHGIDASTAELRPVRFPADPNHRDADGATPLHHAAWDGDLELIGRLLEAGADPGITDLRFDATPLGWAEHAYQTEAAELLRDRTSP